MYYLIVYSFVCINQIDSKILFYNTLDQSHFILILNKGLRKVINMLTSENACVEIPFELYKDKEFRNFISNIENKNMGFFEKISYFKEKPFSPPICDLSNQNNEINIFNRPKYILNNLREVTIYLNNSSTTKYSNNKAASEAYKQFDYTRINNDNKNELDVKRVLTFIELLPQLITFNILGGNILQFRYISKLLDNLLKYKNRIVLHIHYQDLSKINDNYIIELLKNFNINILVDFPLNIEELQKNLLKLKSTNYKLVFLVENNIDFEKSENFIDNLNISSYNQVPFFNGRNLTFFRRNVFITKYDIFQVKYSIVELLINRISNPTYFGKLILNSDGNLYSSFYSEPLDTLDCFIKNKEIIINKLIIDKSSDWILNKPQISPCNKCIYNFLCTQLSNYEKVIGKNNLCTLVK